MSSREYSKEFYEVTDYDSSYAASKVCPILNNLFRPNSIIDIGCGRGNWLYEFSKITDAELCGVDVNNLSKGELLTSETKCKIQKMNLEGEFAKTINRRFFIAMSLEVAEHITKEHNKEFIKNLTLLSDIIVFSAAVPFQRGIGHKSENWPEYWAKIFDEFEYKPVDCIRPKVWNDNNMAAWYKQNIFVYIRVNIIHDFFPDYDHNEPKTMSTIHPYYYLYYIYNTTHMQEKDFTDEINLLQKTLNNDIKIDDLINSEGSRYRECINSLDTIRHIETQLINKHNSFEQEKQAFEQEKQAFEQEKQALKQEKQAFEQEKQAFEQEKQALESTVLWKLFHIFKGKK